jgi:hypothetical protein
VILEAKTTSLGMFTNLTSPSSPYVHSEHKYKAEFGFSPLSTLSGPARTYPISKLFAWTGLTGTVVITATDLPWKSINQNSRLPGFRL